MIESQRVKTQVRSSPTFVELSELVVHTARKFRRNFSSQLAPLGITFAQAQVLRIVARAARPLRMVDLAAKLDIVPRSTTTMIDALQANGLVQRLSDDADRRSVPICITDTGRALLDQLDEARRAVAEGIFGGLSQADCQELFRLLNIVNSQPDAGDTAGDETRIAAIGIDTSTDGTGGIR